MEKISRKFNKARLVPDLVLEEKFPIFMISYLEERVLINWI